MERRAELKVIGYLREKGVEKLREEMRRNEGEQGEQEGVSEENKEVREGRGVVSLRTIHHSKDLYDEKKTIPSLLHLLQEHNSVVVPLNSSEKQISPSKQEKSRKERENMGEVQLRVFEKPNRWNSSFSRKLSHYKSFQNREKEVEGEKGSEGGKREVRACRVERVEDGNEDGNEDGVGMEVGERVGNRGREEKVKTPDFKEFDTIQEEGN